MTYKYQFKTYKYQFENDCQGIDATARVDKKGEQGVSVEVRLRKKYKGFFTIGSNEVEWCACCHKAVKAGFVFCTDCEKERTRSSMKGTKGRGQMRFIEERNWV